MFRKSSDGTQYRQSFFILLPMLGGRDASRLPGISRSRGGKDNNMSEPNGRHVRHSSFGTGFYIALFLCVTALAVAGYRMLLPKSPSVETTASTPVTVPDEEPIRMPQIVVSEPEAETEPAQSAAEIIVEPPEDVPDEFPTLDIAPVEPTLVVTPLTGETIAAFSVESLAYNETLGDWRTHDGVDIAAEVGTPVLSACNGTVTAVENDDLLGTVVRITHDGGYESTYANLQSVPSVGVGQYIGAGQVIGSVGTTSLSESSSAPHLHFSVTKDGESIDPAEFLK